MRFKKWHNLEEQQIDDGNKRHIINTLIVKSKNLPIFNYELDYIDLSIDTWVNLKTDEDFIMHYNACKDADLSKPIILNYNGQLLDGSHRVLKAIAECHKTIPAVKFTEPIEGDYRL